MKPLGNLEAQRLFHECGKGVGILIRPWSEASATTFRDTLGTLINPAFAAEVGWPPLAERDGMVMLSIAAATTLVTAWEVFDAFRRTTTRLQHQAVVGLQQTPSQ